MSTEKAHVAGTCSGCKREIKSTPAQEAWGQKWGYFCRPCRLARRKKLVADQRPGRKPRQGDEARQLEGEGAAL